MWLSRSPYLRRDHEAPSQAPTLDGARPYAGAEGITGRGRAYGGRYRSAAVIGRVADDTSEPLHALGVLSLLLPGLNGLRRRARRTPLVAALPAKSAATATAVGTELATPAAVFPGVAQGLLDDQL